jgi:hypothetical protein
MHTIFLLENLMGRDHSEDGRRWGDNIRIDLKETGWEGADWMDLA